MSHLRFLSLCLAAGSLWLALGGCDGPTSQQSAYDKFHYEITAPEAQQWLGSETIARRADYFRVIPAELPQISFVDHDEAAVRQRLTEASTAVLGEVTRDAPVVDSGPTLSLALDAGGAAWVARESGAFSVKNHDYARTATTLSGAGEAVDRAVAELARLDILSRAEGETLDVVAVMSTHYGGWLDRDGESQAVYFQHPDTGEAVTEYKSEYTVYFGRRYRGVPVVGPTLAVRLDADGQLVALVKTWRDIAGSPGRTLALRPEREIEHDRSVASSSRLDLLGASCGYLEAEGLAATRVHPDVGCLFEYDDPDAGGTLAGRQVEFVSLLDQDGDAP